MNNLGHYITTPFGLAVTSLFILWLVWRLLVRWAMAPANQQANYYNHLAESYDLIHSAHRAVCTQDVVTDQTWKQALEADWIAKTFLEKELRQWTRAWLKKATDGHLFHKNIGKYGPLDMGVTKKQKEEVKDVAFYAQDKQDEMEIIAWLKNNPPQAIYQNYLSTLQTEKA